MAYERIHQWAGELPPSPRNPLTMLALPSPAATFDAHSQREATKRMQHPGLLGVPMEFVRDNASFAGVLSRAHYDRAMHLKRLIEARRGRPEQPMPGDIVETVLLRGWHSYPNAHLDRGNAGGPGGSERYDWKGMSVCLGGSVPFVGEASLGGVPYAYMEASGGPWEVFSRDNLREHGVEPTRPKMFWCWGGYAGASRGIYFWATVKVWTLYI